MAIAAYDEAVDEGWSESETDWLEFACPGCGVTVRHAAWTLVNARHNPELAARLLEGTLFEFTCPDCGYTANLVYPCLYLDPKHRACIYLVVNEGMAQSVEAMFDGLANSDGPTGGPGVIRRIVNNRREFREKALALENGLDDRALALLKAELLKASGYDSVAGVVCDAELVGMGADELVFKREWWGNPLAVTVPRGKYDRHHEAIMHSALCKDQPYRVDSVWVNHALNVLAKRGFRTKDELDRVLAHAGLMLAEPYDPAKSYLKSTYVLAECRTCRKQQHYRLADLVEQKRDNLPYCYVCKWRQWHIEADSSHAGMAKRFFERAARQHEESGENELAALIRAADPFDLARICLHNSLNGADEGSVAIYESLLPPRPMVQKQAEQLAEENGYELVELLDADTPGCEILIVRCKDCGLIAAERSFDIRWGCSCKSTHPFDPRNADTHESYFWPEFDAEDGCLQ